MYGSSYIGHHYFEKHKAMKLCYHCNKDLPHIKKREVTRCPFCNKSIRRMEYYKIISVRPDFNELHNTWYQRKKEKGETNFYRNERKKTDL